jgi:peroxiredoxin Q/BCP
MLATGIKAPDFSLPDANGNKIALNDYIGKKVLIWFFPKADTPGCTMEGCSFRDNFDQYELESTQILGMSADSPAKQKKFVEKYGFQFPMLCDESKEVLRTYHAWGPKKLYGREYEGILRISYLIDETGVIREAYSKVKTKTHALDVLADIRKI